MKRKTTRENALVKCVRLLTITAVLILSCSHINAQYTAIPDAQFEASLTSYDDIPGDGQVPTANIQTVTRLDVADEGISDLTGIQDFIALIELYAYDNPISEIDLSNNTALEIADLSNLALSELNLSTLTALRELTLVNNNLTTLDLSANTNLTYLISTGNSIGSYDLRNNSVLQTLVIVSSATTYINLKNGNNTNISNVSFYGDSSLCVEVDDVSYAQSNWTNAQSIDIYAEYCQYTQIPDANFEAALEDLGYDDISGDGQVPTALIEGVNSLNVENKSIADLTGIEDFTSLNTLRCSNNSITSLDLSQLTELNFLWCQQNLLTSLDLTNNTAIRFISASENAITSFDGTGLNEVNTLSLWSNQLTSLDVTDMAALRELDLFGNSLTDLDVTNNTLLEEIVIRSNSITSLDLSNNTALTRVDVRQNDLTSLDVKNGNNTNITAFRASTNINLSCVLVDDATYSTTNWTDVDAQTSFSDTYCRYTSIPDSSFEAALGFLGYDDIFADGQVPTAVIETLTSLNVSNSNISDLTGIEDFTALILFTGSNNNITTADFSANNSLEEIDLKENPLTGINISSNTNLKVLDLNNALFTSIDLTANTALETLYITNNTNLTSIDVSTNVNLETLGLYSNALTSVTLGSLTVLQELYVENNGLESLDLSLLMGLTDINVSNNNLSSFNLKNGNNTGINSFVATGNSGLECILVDDAVYSTSNWTSVDSQTGFSDTYCRYTTIPDANFEAALEALGYDDISGDGQVPTVLIEGVTSLNVFAKSISDLTGIEDFTALTFLEAGNNSITNIDISENLLLENLRIVNNNLTSIDVSANAQLREIEVYNNNLTTLDLSNNLLLRNIYADGNNLTSIDLSNNSVLEEVELFSNSITTLTLGSHPNMLTFYVNENSISELDLSQLPALEEVDVGNNNLTVLNIKNGNNTAITSSNFEARGNANLTCILVDDSTYSTTNWTAIDAQTSFSDTFCNTIAPTVICQDITVQLDQTGNVTIAAQDIDNGSTDDGTIVSMVIDIDSFDCTDIGDHIVTLTVTDDGGNSDSCTATVTVEDTIAPQFNTATLPEDIDVTFNNGTGDAYILEDFTFGVGYFDNCDSNNRAISISQNPVAGTELAQGDHLIVLTITDDQGNETEHSFTVTVSPTLTLEDNSIDGLAVYPNPTRDRLFITIDIHKVLIYNINGQKVMQANTKELDMSELTSGVYFAHIFTDKGNDVIRIVKQ